MKLLLNAAFDTRVAVGISKYIRQMVRELAQLCEVTVLTPDPELLADACEAIRIADLTRSGSRRFVWAMTSLRGYCTGRYDAILSVTPVVPPMVGIPTVATVHDLTPLVMSRSHRARDKAAFWLGLQTLRWAGAVVCDSRNTRRDLLRHRLLRPERVHVIPLGPGLLPSPKSEPDGNLDSIASRLQPYILYVGGHPSHKNVSRLLEAFARLSVSTNTKLVIVGWGTGQQVTATRSVIDRLGLSGRVVLLADLPDGELSELYSRCLLFVFPSLYEGFGLPVLEALAHGAPVACSGASSIPEIAGDAVVYFDPLSVSDIGRTLQSLLDDAGLAGRLRTLGPAQANRYSWAETARMVHDVVRGLRTTYNGRRAGD